jgi:hypothetical protein
MTTAGAVNVSLKNVAKAATVAQTRPGGFLGTGPGPLDALVRRGCTPSDVQALTPTVKRCAELGRDNDFCCDTGLPWASLVLGRTDTFVNGQGGDQARMSPSSCQSPNSLSLKATQDPGKVLHLRGLPGRVHSATPPAGLWAARCCPAACGHCSSAEEMFGLEGTPKSLACRPKLPPTHRSRSGPVKLDRAGDLEVHRRCPDECQLRGKGVKT